MTIDIAPLWDFNDPAASEARFRTALETATGDDALILRTQIARTYGLRGDFSQARTVLEGVERELGSAGPEVRVRHLIELGRTHASTRHSQESQTDEAREAAREAYMSAVEAATAADLDALAVDALHMMALVDTEPIDQLRWGEKALRIAESSRQPAARKWEAVLRHNIGYALHLLGRYDEALPQFERALALRQKASDPGATRVARWMVAWTLRALGRNDEALEAQLALEQACEEAGAPDPYVFEELEALYRARGEVDRADHYAARRKALADSEPGS